MRTEKCGIVKNLMMKVTFIQWFRLYIRSMVVFFLLSILCYCSLKTKPNKTLTESLYFCNCFVTSILYLCTYLKLYAMRRGKYDTASYNVITFLEKIVKNFVLDKHLFIVCPCVVSLSCCYCNAVAMKMAVRVPRISECFTFWKREFGWKKSAYTPRVVQTIKKEVLRGIVWNQV